MEAAMIKNLVATLAVLAAFAAAPARAPRGAILQAGFAKRVITPKLGAGPVYLAGFDQNRVATGVHDDLFARAVAVSDGTSTVALVAVDLIGLSLDESGRMREALALRAPAARLVVASTHNHEGPDTMGLWGPAADKSGTDRMYLAFVRQQVVEAAAEAVAGMTPARLILAKGRTPDLIEDGRLPKVLDDEIRVAQFVDQGGRALGTLVNWSNHPEALGGKNTLVTADFPHFLAARMESSLGGSCVFTVGAIGGLMTPLGVKLTLDGAEVPRESFEHARWIGDRAASAALEALRSRPHPSRSETVRIETRSLFAALGNLRFRAAAALGVLERPLFTNDRLDDGIGTADLGGRTLRVRTGRDLKTEVGHLRIGDLEVLAVPGEIYPELVFGGIQDPQDPGADFPGASRERPLFSLMATEHKMILGLADDEIGYIIPRAQRDETPPFAYGRRQSQYGETNSAGDQIAPAIARVFESHLGPVVQ
jgi:hypothetical protein